MAGTLEGGRLDAKTNRERYGEDYYKKLGIAGGRKSRNGGFASQVVGRDGLTGVERAIVVGRKGGLAKKQKVTA